MTTTVDLRFEPDARFAPDIQCADAFGPIDLEV
jgi:hypothetical protein